MSFSGCYNHTLYPFLVGGAKKYKMNGNYKNGVPIIVDTSKYGVTIMPEPIYHFPKGHPCYGCVFTLNMSKPSCLTGSYPNTETCINAFYKKLQAKHKYEHETKLKEV